VHAYVCFNENDPFRNDFVRVKVSVCTLMIRENDPFRNDFVRVKFPFVRE